MDLETALRDHGCRVTQARRVVWDVLDHADQHLSAHEVTERVHKVDATINVSSVYRALTVFAELGLVRESRLDDTATWERFHGDASIHLICDVCGRVDHHNTDVVNGLRADLDRSEGFVPDSIDVRVTGRCARCAEQPDPGETPTSGHR